MQFSTTQKKRLAVLDIYVVIFAYGVKMKFTVNQSNKLTFSGLLLLPGYRMDEFAFDLDKALDELEENEGQLFE